MRTLLLVLTVWVGLEVAIVIFRRATQWGVQLHAFPFYGTWHILWWNWKLVNTKADDPKDLRDHPDILHHVGLSCEPLCLRFGFTFYRVDKHGYGVLFRTTEERSMHHFLRQIREQGSKVDDLEPLKSELYDYSKALDHQDDVEAKNVLDRQKARRLARAGDLAPKDLKPDRHRRRAQAFIQAWRELMSEEAA